MPCIGAIVVALRLEVLTVCTVFTAGCALSSRRRGTAKAHNAIVDLFIPEWEACD